MGLRLHTVPAQRGLGWIRDALALWWKRPMAFVGLFMFFLFCALTLMLVPVVGPLLGLSLVPMLTLGFMIASKEVLQGGAVHPLQVIEGLRVADAPRRNAQLMLCALYGLASIGVIELAAWVDEGLFEQWQIAMATPGTTPEAVQALLTDPRLAQGMLVRVVAATLMSVPFWHAPALVHWGHQGAWQALFSSTMAKGAFTLYGLGWGLLSLGVGLLATVAVLLLGSGQLVSVLIMPAGMVLSAVFYVSLWFIFADSFGDEVAAPPDGP